MNSPTRLRIGQIVAAHGIRGQVRVRLLTDLPERLKTMTEVQVGAEARPRGVSFSAFHKGQAILSLAGVTDRTAAEALVGQDLYRPLADLPPLPEGEYYFWQLIGLQVYSAEGELLGKTVDFDHGAASDYYTVETLTGQRCLVPAVPAIVVEVDPEAGRLVINNLPGLLE